MIARHPNGVMDELGFRNDPANLYQQTITSVLDAGIYHTEGFGV